MNKLITKIFVFPIVTLVINLKTGILYTVLL